MIKNFACYRKLERLSGGQTLWEKKYPDCQTAQIVVDDRRVTRQRVIDAFSEQEYQAYDDDDRGLFR